MKTKDLREMNEKELEQKLQERNDVLRHFRLQLVNGALDNVKAAKNARRDIARILTIRRERALAAEKAK